MAGTAVTISAWGCCHGGGGTDVICQSMGPGCATILGTTLRLPDNLG